MKISLNKIISISFIGIFLSIGIVNATSVFQIYQGGTGTSTSPTIGQVLVGQSDGTYGPQATSTLGITCSNCVSTTSGDWTGTWQTFSPSHFLTNLLGGLDAIIGSTTANKLVITTNLGIGTSSPQSTLDVNGSTTIRAAASASSSALILTGALTSGGTGTNSFPNLFLNPTGSPVVTNWSTSGTLIGATLPTFAGNFVDFHQSDGQSVFKVTNNGNLLVPAGLQILNSGAYILNQGAYTQQGTVANTFTGPTTFSNATYSALFTGGNVGIGTTSPSEALDVRGNIRVLTGGSGNGIYGKDGAGVYLYSLTRQTTIGEGLGISSYGSIGFAPQNSVAAISTNYKMVINGSGNVGIGTTTPVTILSVIGTTTTSGLNVSNVTNSVLGTDASGNVQSVTPTGYTLLAAGSVTTAVNTAWYWIGMPVAVSSSGNPPEPYHLFRMYIPKAGTIKQMYLNISNFGTLGSGETGSVVLLKNGTLVDTIWTGLTTNQAGFSIASTSLNYSVATGDYLEWQYRSPTWATPPTNLRWGITTYIE